MENGKEKITLRSTLKSMDTEETIDLWFYRPIGYVWALLFRRLGISPNAVTIASIFIGIAAGILFYFDNLMYNVAGMLLLIWANSFDSADGQLARMTGKYSRLGRILDGLSGDLWFITIYIALCLRLMNEGWNVSVFALGAIAGYFHAQQASMADYYRNFHLFFVKGKSGSELEDMSQLEQNFKKLTWKKDFMTKLVQFFYIGYTRTQERLTPNMQELRSIIRSKYGDNVPEWLRVQFRAKSLPLMKYTNMLSFNTRVIALFISLFLDEVWLYFVFELTVLNIMLIYMRMRHEKICDDFVKKLTAL
ncbi:CDP-alcohol phosphatidyltransferase family protein [Coprobacter tertius]|uniref:CDP-alcohol phosphatidyltransferase family protein n=1 Tax=Coprobacter tertius TaxID=2944915 RepID=A0ABT1MES0_9BACT|nr:CDP-alcohol phosphatidyltransferase family protein [Coprobacter tertius]MCP9611120.1 CDP-alcohol phosphatidyltransferase family protein [Coprobacter tertius]